MNMRDICWIWIDWAYTSSKANHNRAFLFVHDQNLQYKDYELESISKMEIEELTNMLQQGLEEEGVDNEIR